jgi:hypothetical protein
MIRTIVEAALEARTEDFSRLHSRMGRPSTPSEMLLRAMLLQAFAFGTAGRLVGRIFIHKGDDSGFVVLRE